MMRTASGMIVVLVSFGVAQEKPLPQTDRSIPVDQQRATGTLPTFDLPQFVITGRESIDLPAAEKKTFPASGTGMPILRPSEPAAVRDDPDVVGGSIRRVTTGIPSPHSGRAYMGLGSFSSLALGLQASGVVGQLHLLGGAEYTSTTGYSPHTDANAFHVHAGLRSPTTFLGAAAESEHISALGGFSRSSYSWYGSQRPGAGRSVSSGNGSVMMSGMLPPGSRGSLGISYVTGSITDSTITVREGIFSLRSGYSGIHLGLPMTMHLQGSSGGRTGGSDGKYGGLEVGIRADWSPADIVSSSFSIALATVSGEDGQQKTTFLPGFSASFMITPEHRFVGRYAPAVRMQGLLEFTDAIPFLDASQYIRHAIVRNQGSISIESDWSDVLRSSVSLESSRWSDYPIVADTGHIGIFRLFYGDVTETLLRLSVVAKLPVNHYFSAIAILRSSKGSTSGLSVPYLPSSELRMTYRNEVSEEFEVEGTLQVVSARESVLTGPSRSLSAYTRADLRVTYSVLAGLKVWAGARNLFDARIEHWAGYAEMPFALNIGLSYSL